MSLLICTECSKQFESKKCRDLCSICTSTKNLKKSRKIRIDITGNVYGNATVVSYSHTKNASAYWVCRLSNGNIVIKPGKELKKHNNRKFRSSNYSKCELGAYNSWYHMNNRCYNPLYTGYKNYGGRGITVCHNWRNSFESFKNDMGERPVGKTLDRIFNDANYCIENCRWSTKSEQQRNRSDSIYLEAFGKKQPLNQWGEEYGIKAASIYWRIKNGWNIEDAISIKVQRKKSTSIDR